MSLASRNSEADNRKSFGDRKPVKVMSGALTRDKLRSGCFLRIVAAAALLLAASASAFASEECRQPTPEEKAAVDKLVNVLKREMVTSLLPAGWRLAGEKSAQNTLVVIATHPNPARPLMDCGTLFDVRLQADPSSKRGQDAQAAMKGLTGTATADDIKKIAQVMASAEVHIRAGENNPTLRDQRTEQIKALDLQGAAVAYQEPADDDGTVTTVVCFGGFKHDVTFGTVNKRIPYPFVHGPQTPFIENMCVNIHSTPETTDEILKKINWSNLNQALTP